MAKQKSNDALILSLKDKIEEKKKLLKTTEKFSPVTNCILSVNGEKYNLNVLGKNDILILVAHLSSLKTALKNELPDESLEISGFTVDQWLKDLKAKFNTLNRKLEEDRLKALERKLHELLSTDKKVELEIADIMQQI